LSGDSTLTVKPLIRLAAIMKIRTLNIIVLILFSGIVMSQETDNNDHVVKSFFLKSKTTNTQVNDSNLHTVLKMQLSIPEDYTLIAQKNDGTKMVTKKTDKLGYQHQRFVQYYKGIKIENSDIRVHSKDSSMVSANGDYVNQKGIDIKTTLSQEEALECAKRYINAKRYIWEDVKEVEWLSKIFSTSFIPTPELVISKNFIDPTDTLLHLTYKIDIYAVDPLSRSNVYVDAKNGEIINVNSIIDNFYGVAATRYSDSRDISTEESNSQYRLRDYDINRGDGIKTLNMNHGTSYSSATDFYDDDNDWTYNEYHNTNKDDGALDAHWGAMMTYDYFKQVHGRDSYDDNGSEIVSYVHYSYYYENAFWNGSFMTYGDGDYDYDILTSLDIVAHEIGHGVCAHTADLFNFKEFGAIKESLSDIWAACVENYAAPEKEIWLIGDEIDLRTENIALRSMSNPNVEGQPDTYGGTNWFNVNGCVVNDYNDRCGVHTNSGVMNYWFYLLSVGGSGTNDINNSYNVSGISIEKAEKIVYRAESAYMTFYTMFNTARTYTIQAAKDLYGDCSQEAISTMNAWYAVGVGSAFTSDSISDVTYISDTTVNACNVILTNVNVQNGATLTINAPNGFTLKGNSEIELGSQLKTE
jgi:bacillolysin